MNNHVYAQFRQLPIEVRADLEEGGMREYPDDQQVSVFLDPSEKGTIYEVNVVIPEDLGVAYSKRSTTGKALCKLLRDLP